MTLQKTTCQALGMDLVGLAAWLRKRIDAGEPLAEVLDLAKELDLHPLSLALCAPEGQFRPGRDQRNANRQVARQLGLDDPWISQIHGNGLRIRDPQIHCLPEKLAMPRLDLSRLKGLVEVPETTYARWLRVHQCHKLERVPLVRGLRKLELLDTHGMKEIPEGLNVETLKIAACPAMEALTPCRAEYLGITGCTHFRQLEEGVAFKTLLLKRLPLLEPSPALLRAMAEGKVRIQECPLVPGAETETS